MNFLAPWMFWGSLAAGIPIALHFFFRSRYRTVPWAAMKFLLTSIEQTSRRLRFQELLLLILRCLVLAMLAFAFARPISSALRGTGRGDAVDATFVFDVSYSMNANDGSRSRLERAQEEAVRILEQLPPHSTVQVVVAAQGYGELLGPRSPSNLDQAKHLILDLPKTHLQSELLAGVQKAGELVPLGHSPNKEIYVFTDHQTLAWDTQSESLVAQLKKIHEKATVYFVRCGSRPLKNVAVIGITPQSGVPRPGDRVGFAVLVRNTTNDTLSDLKVSLTVDGDEKSGESTLIPKLGPKETRTVPISARIEKAGLRVLTAKVGPDDLDSDNRFDQVLLVRDQVNILVVDGNMNERDPSKSSSYFLSHALQPVRDADRPRYHLQPRVVPARLASPALLAKQDLCLLVNVALEDKLGISKAAPTDFTRELGRFVRQGKGLAIFAGENVQPDAYNRILGKELDLLPFKLKSVHVTEDAKPLHLARSSFLLSAFSKFKDDEYYKDFDQVEFWRTLTLEETGSASIEKKAEAVRGEGEKSKVTASVALRFADGKPALVRKQVEGGEVLFLTTAVEPGKPDPKTLNPTWTDWPFRLSLFVPFVDVAVSHLLHEQTQNHNVVAGDTVTWYPISSPTTVWSLAGPDGNSTRLGYSKKNGARQELDVGTPRQGGVYRLFSKASMDELDPLASAGVPIAVTPSLAESEDLSSLSNEQIDAKLGFAPIHLTASGDSSDSAAERLQREWTPWVLWIVLFLCAGESLLAWFCGKAW